MNAQQLGRYQLLGVLGKGAMGIVYEARDPRLDRLVAIKTIRLTNATEEQAANYERRFLTEARSAARLRHPAIVNVYDAGHDDDVAYLVMEKVIGINLKHCLNEGVRLSMGGATRTLLNVLSALEHAHQHRILHRDVKPENLLLDAAGLVKLTDFGIAKIQELGADNGTQLSGGVIGTPRYMSPEQISGLAVDNRSDLFSAGVLLYELLTGRVPFDGNHPMAVANNIIHVAHLPPSTLNEVVWPSLDAVVAKALQKRPEDRFLSAAEFATALRASLNDAAGGQAPLATKLSSAVDMATPATAAVLAGLFVRARRPAQPDTDPYVANADAVADGATQLDTQTSIFSQSRLPKDTKNTHAATPQKPTATHFSVGAWMGAAALLMAAGVLVWLWQTPNIVEPATAPATPPVPTLLLPVPASPVVPAEVPVPGPAPQTVAPTIPMPMPMPMPIPSLPAPKPAAAAPVPTTPAQPRPPAAAPEQPVQPSVKPEKKAEGAKCSRLLEKASSGEPLSELDQKELITSCR